MRPGATDPQARSEGREGGGGLYREGALCEWEPPTCAFCGGCGEHCLVDLCLLGAQARIEPGSHLWRGERLPVFKLLLQSTSDRVACAPQKCVSHSSGGWKATVGVPARPSFGEGLLPGYKQPSPWRLLRIFSPGTCAFTRAPPMAP